MLSFIIDKSRPFSSEVKRTYKYIHKSKRHNPCFLMLLNSCESFVSFKACEPPLKKNLYLWKAKLKTQRLVSKVGDRSRGRLEGSFFNSYYTEV